MPITDSRDNSLKVLFYLNILLRLVKSRPLTMDLYLKKEGGKLKVHLLYVISVEDWLKIITGVAHKNTTESMVTYYKLLIILLFWQNYKINFNTCSKFMMHK